MTLHFAECMFLIEFFKGESTALNTTEITVLSRKSQEPISKINACSNPRIEECDIQVTVVKKSQRD